MEKLINRSFLSVTDHSVTKEIFDLNYDDELDLLITNPKPDPETMHVYYDSPEYISHTDGQKSIIDKIYRIVKRIAISRKVALITNRRRPGKLLDIGSGTGDFILAASNNGWDTLGLEPNHNARKIAIGKGAKLLDNTNQISAGSIDVITMWHVLEHISDPDAQLKELKRLLKPGGRIYIAVPNYKSYDAKYYGRFWAAFDVPRHLWHFSKRSIKLLAIANGLKLVAIHPMIFDSFYVSILSEKYMHNKMYFFSGMFRGLLSNLKALKSAEYSSHIYVLQHEN